MNSTKFESFVLHHDGDFDGPMIISQGNLDPIAFPEQEGVQIIVTRLDIQKLLDGDTETVLLSGPDNSLYDRHDITTGPDFNEIVPGDYQIRTIEVSRNDLKNANLYFHAYAFQELIEKIIDLDDVEFATNTLITLKDHATSLLREYKPNHKIIDNEKIESDEWEKGVFGRSEQHTKKSDLDQSDVDAALGFQQISIRIPSDLMENIQLIGKIKNLSYQPLIKQVLTSFVDHELKNKQRD